MPEAEGPALLKPTVDLRHDDCLVALRRLSTNSLDAVVTDPPYGLEFMGKDWDKFGVGKQPKIGQPDGSKFRQNMGTPSFTDNGNPTCRNCRGDKYRNGPRKCSCDSPDFGNPQAESMRGFQQWCGQWTAECLRVLKPGGHIVAFGGTRTWHRLAVAVEDAGFEIRDSIAWLYASGFPKSRNVSNAIKGGLDEPKTPESERWQGWGTALKPAFEPIVVGRKPLAGTVAANVLTHGTGALNIDASKVGLGDDRWPANVLLDESQAHAFEEARFFYCAKAPKSERPVVYGVTHPTVKPLALMRWLVRLVTPPGGTVLDPFAGSGTTVEAAILEGFDVIGIERDGEYLSLIQARVFRARPAAIAEAEKVGQQFDLFGEAS